MSFINYCTTFHTNNCKPPAPPRVKLGGLSTEGLVLELRRGRTPRFLKTGVWSGGRTHLARTKVCDSEWAAGTCGKVGRAARGGWRPAETNSDPSPQGQGQQNSDKEANLVAAQRSAEKCQMERGSRGGAAPPAGTSLRCHRPSFGTGLCALHGTPRPPWPSIPGST